MPTRDDACFDEECDSASSLGAARWTKRSVALWLGIWFAVGLALRFTNLTLKAAWMDEVATTIFSLGNYSRLIPLNEVINLEQILRPLTVRPEATAQDVVSYLLIEDNHPPTYFVLAHWWMKLFPSVNGYASLWGERSLSALFGALAIPATYLLAQFSFQDTSKQNASNTRTLSMLCAALMAASPFGIFMAQEARHYTLAILAVIASLCCFVLAAKAIAQQKTPSWRIILSWIVINAIGLTTHFFVGLTLIAEGMTLLLMLIQQCRQGKGVWMSAYWQRIYAAAFGTLAGGLLWLPILTNFYGSPQTSFLRSEGRSWQFWINPIVQSFASWLYAVLSPVTGGYGGLAVAMIVLSCLLLLFVYIPMLIAALRKGISSQRETRSLRLGITVMGGFFVMANLLFLFICYSSGFDITRGHRYSFVFFPSVILLVGVGIAPFWERRKGFESVELPLVSQSVEGRKFVIGVGAIALLGSLVIVNHYSNLKFYRPERFIDLMQSNSAHPVIIGAKTIVTEQPSVIGIEIMSVAWEIERQMFKDAKTADRWVDTPRFVIAETNSQKGLDAEEELVRSLSSQTGPLDLWLLSMSPDLSDTQCQLAAQGSKGSFGFTHYICNEAEDIANGR